MGANTDEAAKCLGVARRALEAGDREKAARFLAKAASMDPKLAGLDEVRRQCEAAEGRGTRQEARGSPHSGGGGVFGAQDAGTGGARQQGPTLPQRRPSAAGGGAAAGSAAAGANNATPAQRKLVREVMAAKKDYYKMLGLSRGADADEVKKAYRKLALKLHPDKCQAPGADEAFKLVSRAYACLSDDQKKAHYDWTPRVYTYQNGRQTYGKQARRVLATRP